MGLVLVLGMADKDWLGLLHPWVACTWAWVHSVVVAEETGFQRVLHKVFWGVCMEVCAWVRCRGWAWVAGAGMPTAA